MSQWFKLASRNTPTLFLIVSMVLGVAMGATATAEELLSRSPERGGIGLELQQLQYNEGFNKNYGNPLRPGLLSKLDERLSIIVTDKDSTSAITFSEVMDKLAEDMDVDKRMLFRRWWDTAELTPGNPFCHSETQKLHGFPYQCPRDEHLQPNPFNDSNPCDGYTAIAFVNRFDLADKDRGRHCGEFRIVFARNSGFGAAQNCNVGLDKRLLIIFEALVLNPKAPPSPQTPTPDDPFVNLKECRPIVEFWLSLSDPDMSPTKRGTALRNFFIKGLPGIDPVVGPVVDKNNYAGGPFSGQIRTNQFMQPWTLREFKIDGSRIIPAAVKSVPGNSLFWDDSRKLELADYLVRADTLATLRGKTSSTASETNIDTFAFALTDPAVDHLNSFESQAQLPNEGAVLEAYENCQERVACGKTDMITKKLESSLTESVLDADNIIRRIQTQTCAGCHHYSNGEKYLNVHCPIAWPSTLCFVDEKEFGDKEPRGIWPRTLPDAGEENNGFTHVSEEEIEKGTDKEVFDLRRAPFTVQVTPQNLRSIRRNRISHLSYRGPKGSNGENTRYKISDTLKLLLMPPRYENMVLYLNQFQTAP